MGCHQAKQTKKQQPKQSDQYYMKESEQEVYLHDLQKYLQKDQNTNQPLGRKNIMRMSTQITTSEKEKPEKPRNLQRDENFYKNLIENMYLKSIIHKKCILQDVKKSSLITSRHLRRSA